MNAFDYFFEHSKELEKDFVIGRREVISFSRLYRDSLKLAGFLYAKYGKEKNILLIAPNSTFFITCYLAIIKSGNVVIPLNTDIEQLNLDYIVSICEPEVLIIPNLNSKRLDFSGPTPLTEIQIKDIVSMESLERSSPESVSPSQLAEIIFTSGSTGEPKGVMITHKNLIANTKSIISYLNLGLEDIMLVVLPFYYCYGLSLLHTHLRVGGSIVLNNMFFMLGSVISDFNKYKCTGFAGVPTHFQMLLRKSDTFKTGYYPYLKYVTQAGGKLHDTFILEFSKAFPSVSFYVMYGQTEATARLSYLPPERLLEKIGSCGKGIPGVQLKVVDDCGENIEPGKTGEIIAFGENIMAGYYKDKNGTDQTLKNGWLYTGDLATVDKEGYIFLTARKKEIIKVGGKRVSPKEIEEVIVSLPEVIDCIVTGINDEILGEALKATLVIRESFQSKYSESDIKKLCATRLAMYKVPQIIEFQDRITISPTGKKIKK